jgi:orotidine-5'-phosphate decarboxylase
MNFADRLDAALERVGTPCLVGLDPHVDLLPAPFDGARDGNLPRAERARWIGEFCCQVIDLVAGRVAAVKPQSAFFEAFGADGAVAWERVVAHARAAGLLVIGDVKRGDIASTAAAYATAFLEGPPGCQGSSLCDAVTLNPFLGADSVEPFLAACRRSGAGLFVLVRTSNPGSADFQRHGEPELSVRVAEAVARWGSGLMGQRGMSSIGAVVGATHPRELALYRRALPSSPLLLPGYGAQGAGAADVMPALLAGARGAPRGALINSSRGITFAYREPRWQGVNWKDAARGALDQMIAEIQAAWRAGH